TEKPHLRRVRLNCSSAVSSFGCRGCDHIGVLSVMQGGLRPLADSRATVEVDTGEYPVTSGPDDLAAEFEAGERRVRRTAEMPARPRRPPEVIVDEREARWFSDSQRPSGELCDAPDPGRCARGQFGEAPPVQPAAVVEDVSKNGRRGLQTDHSERSVTPMVVLALRGVRGVVCGHCVDGAVEDGFSQGSNVVI